MKQEQDKVKYAGIFISIKFFPFEASTLNL